MKHAKPNPNKKRIAAAALAVGTTGSIPLVFAGPAHADNSIDCKDIGHQVDTSAGDPNGLDADGDGVGCESFPGPATPLDGAATLAPRALVATTPATKDDTACEDYIVNRGDNLSTIAARYGVPLADLEALNPGIIAGDRPDDYSLIFRGGHVHLPDGSCTPVKPVPVPPRHKHERPVHVWYRDCTDAPAGLHRGQAGYRHSLDMDGDGKACEGPWPPVTTPPADNPPPSDGGGSTTPPASKGIGDGVYLAGTDIQSGEYKTDGPPADSEIGECYWQVSTDAQGNDIVANGLEAGPMRTTVEDGQYIEFTGGCTWTLVSDGGSGTPPPVTTPPADGTITPAIAPDGPGTKSGYVAHPVAFWAPLIEQAKGLVGVNYSTSAIESLMLSESSGDPNAINDYDVNAQNGDPSRGLMQTIGATFNAYHVDGTSDNIYDPLANIAAALNYIKDVYGYVPNSPY